MLHHKVKALSNSLRKNKVTIILVAAAFVGGVIGSSLLFPVRSNASFFTDLYNSFISGSRSISGGGSVSSSAPVITSDHEQAVMNAVQKTSPAVVSIIISKDLPVIEQCPYDPFSNIPQQFQQFFNFGGGTQFYQPCQKGTKKQDIGGGSGFIVSSDGLIVTNKHVVSDTKAEYTVLTNDGKKYSAKVLARHPSLDVAVLKIDASGLPKVELGDSGNLKLGQTAIAIGNSLGEFRNTVSVGVVSGLARTITASDNSGTSETINNVIQTDAAINPGNSGGPLLNLSGQVVGIDVAMVSDAQSIGFAIPINAVKQSIASVTSSGALHVAYLGVRYMTLSGDIKDKYSLDIDHGAFVKGDATNYAVEPNSPADKAGLKEGDVITAVDGEQLDDNNTLSYVISQKNPGDVITLTVHRDKQDITVKVTLGERK